MKKAIGITLMLAFCFVEVIFASSAYKIHLRRNSGSNVVEVQCDGYICNIRPSDAVGIGDFAIGHWNGETFSIESRTGITANMTISSVDIPLVFHSLLSEKCHVNTPNLRILGETRINDFFVTLNGEQEGILTVSGDVLTKNFNVSGSVVVDGSMRFSNEGVFKLNSIRLNPSLTVNGHLLLAGDFKIDMTKSIYEAKITNNGEISSDIGTMSFIANSFFNGERGRIIGENVLFQLESQFQNDGIMEFNDFSFKIPQNPVDTPSMQNIFRDIFMLPNDRDRDIVFHHIRFLQNGSYTVHNRAIFDCGIESFGQTRINHLIFSSPSSLNISGGETAIGQVSGRVSICHAKGGANARIGDMEDGAAFFSSSGSLLEIGRSRSDQKSVFSSESGGHTIVGYATAPVSFIYSDDGSIAFSQVDGKSSALMTGTSKLKMKRASEFKLVTKEESKAQVERSTVKTAHLLSTKKSSFVSTHTTFLSNKGELEAVDTQTKRLDNRGNASFFGNTSTERINNYGKATFKDGDHSVGVYSGKTEAAKLKVKGEEVDEEEDSEMQASNAHVILRDGSAKVSIRKAQGTSALIASHQTHKGSMPTTFRTVGNVDVFMDHMPKPWQIPLHDGGSFRIHINMLHDYINRDNSNYGNVLFFMNMHGHKWENRNATFIAGGLKVDNASIFGNYDGRIFLKDFLNVHAGQIFNIARPLARENGRWIDVWPTWWAHLVYYCPATYYSPNPNVGIFVDRSIRLKSTGDILNKFSNVYAFGNFVAETERNFENLVGTIIALGSEKSTIKAISIINACLPAFLRKGEAYAERTAGWGWNRRTKYAHHSTAEWITQSPGALMSFGGDVEFVGSTRNFGSVLLSSGRFIGSIDSERSLFENIAVHGSAGGLIEGDYINFESPFIFMHRGASSTNSESRLEH